MLLPSDPSPPDAGAKIRNAGLIRLLRDDHEVDILAYGLPRRRSTMRRVVDLARSRLPDMALRLWTSEFDREVQCRLRERRYDAVQAEGIEMAPYLRGVKPEQRIYDAHNAEFLLQQRLAAAGGLGSLYSRLQWHRLERFERALVRGSRMTLAVSEHDANQLLALAGGIANVQVVPNAIHVSSYAFRPPASAVKPNLLFVGKLDFRPNANAVSWLIRDVLPHLEEAKLFAVGAAPPQWLVRAGQHDPRIAVAGYVADERPYFARSAALVLPVQTGGGSRLKALVAMASGLPIVSTRFGMEGLEAEAGIHYLQADTAAEWVDLLVRVLADADLRQRLACEARALVTERYDWTARREQVRAAYAWL